MCHLDSRLNRIDIILIPSRYIFFSRSPTVKNSVVKHIWFEGSSGWVSNGEVFVDAYKC
jgi:hypothetical protein